MKSTSLIFILLSSLLCWNCEEVFLPDLEGSLVGYVFTFDEFANLLDDHSQVRVTAPGMQRAYPNLTDASGRFELMHLPAGTYDLRFEKPGFGTMKQFGIQHLGGKPTIFGVQKEYYFRGTFGYYAIFIYQLPTTEILSLSIENDTLTGLFEFTGPAPENIGLRTYYSTDPGFKLEQAEVVSNYTLTLTGVGEKYQKIIPINYLSRFFSPGEEIFFKACVYSTAGNFKTFDNVYIRGIDTYVDYETNSSIYPNLGDESPEFSFVFPE